MKKNDNDFHRHSSIDRCTVVELPRHYDAEGSISVVENVDGAPFPYAGSITFTTCLPTPAAADIRILPCASL